MNRAALSLLFSVGPLQLEFSRSCFYDFIIDDHSTYLVAIDIHANKMR